MLLTTRSDDLCLREDRRDQISKDRDFVYSGADWKNLVDISLLRAFLERVLHDRFLANSKI